MTEPKRGLVVDIVAPQPAPKAPETKTTFFGKLRNRLSGKQLLHKGVYLAAATLAVVCIAAICVWYYQSTHTESNNLSELIPQNIRQQAPFNLYIPDPSKLPPGYTLSTQSFSYGNNALLYKVTYGSNQALIVTVQQKPSANAIAQFYKAHMPITIPIQTKVGAAALGVLNNETVVSLPTTTNAWLLMTAPLNANQSQVKQVLHSMTLAQ